MKGPKVVNERRQRLQDALYGLNVVESWLSVDPRRLRRLFIRAKPSGRLLRLASSARIAQVAVEEVDEAELVQVARTRRHQGVVAIARDFAYAELDEVLQRRASVLVAIDQIQDPRNLGAVLRTAAAVRVGGIILPKDGCVGITSTVEVAAAGASARVPVARVTNLVRAILASRNAGYWAVALDARADKTIFDLETMRQTLLIIGGEGGVRPLVLRSCDEMASIPMPGGTESLNVSVAASIALYDLFRRGERPDSLP